MTAPAAASAGPRRPDAVIAGWSPIRPPYRALREPLAVAEQRLNDPVDRERAVPWRHLRDAVGDDRACAAAVDQLLAALVHAWQVVPVGDGWRVALIPPSSTEVADLAAAQALVLLVESAGWSRLKRCGKPDCQQVFLDWTNGGNRRACRAHPDRVPVPAPARSGST